MPLEVLEIRNVGPTLGQESIDQSLRAGIIGLILVAIYILVFYRSPGLLADVALGIYVVLVLGALVAMRAVLTLPGIAGFILSIGMAVDVQRAHLRARTGRAGPGQTAAGSHSPRVEERLPCHLGRQPYVAHNGSHLVLFWVGSGAWLCRHFERRYRAQHVHGHRL